MIRSNKIVTGIFSGSFNPIHTAHLLLAQYLSQYEDLDEIWFLPTPHNPLKEVSNLAPYLHRTAMVKIAIANNPLFACCEIEKELPTPSYTIDTLDILQKLYPNRIFHLIIGSDNWQVIEKWRDWKRLVENYPINIYPREGYEVSPHSIAPFPHVRCSKAPRIEISATLIREAIANDKKINYFLPQEVYQYIIDNKLYK